MRLVIREYLSMLREAEELDRLLPDLVLAMGLSPLSRPGRGPRQYGVDLPAVGIDPGDRDRRVKLFLFTIKAGNLNRNNWNSGKQALRPSLDEIFDIYLRKHVLPEHRTLPKKIVVVINGELKQDLQLDWVSYVERQAPKGPAEEGIELELWAADHLAPLVERYLLSEKLFPEKSRKNLRKTIALADQGEEEPEAFFRLIEDSVAGLSTSSSRKGRPTRRQVQALRGLNLALNIVFHWCRECDNLKTPFLAAERTVLRVWDWLRCSREPSQDERQAFFRIFSTYLTISLELAAKLEPHCSVRDGIAAQGVDEIEYPLRVFEIIGWLGTISLAAANFAHWANADKDLAEHLLQVGQRTSELLSRLIRENPGAWTPLLDAHSIEIAIALVCLARFGLHEPAGIWVIKLAQSILFAYQIGKHFPISSDSVEDLFALKLGTGPSKEDLFKSSTVLPLLGCSFLMLGLEEQYAEFQKGVRALLPKTAHQLWFPDQNTEETLYSARGRHESGHSVVFRGLPENFDQLRQLVERLRQEQTAHRELSCLRNGWPVLALIASRHHRTPVVPAFWMEMLPGLNNLTESEISQERSESPPTTPPA